MTGPSFKTRIVTQKQKNSLSIQKKEEAYPFFIPRVTDIKKIHHLIAKRCVSQWAASVVDLRFNFQLDATVSVVWNIHHSNRSNFILQLVLFHSLQFFVFQFILSSLVYFNSRLKLWLIQLRELATTLCFMINWINHLLSWINYIFWVFFQVLGKQ